MYISLFIKTVGKNRLFLQVVHLALQCHLLLVYAESVGLVGIAQLKFWLVFNALMERLPIQEEVHQKMTVLT